MSLTTDRNDPGLNNIKPDGQQEKYLVLSEEERAKGWVRPYRDSYVHIGNRIKGTIRLLSDEEKEQYKDQKWVAFDEYPPGEGITGRYMTEEQYKNTMLNNGITDGCMGTTTMGRALSETYARDPKFYSGTFCVICGQHFPVGQFVWSGTNELVGS